MRKLIFEYGRRGLPAARVHPGRTFTERGCPLQIRLFSLSHAVERRGNLSRMEGREQFDLRSNRARRKLVGDPKDLHLRSNDPEQREATKEVRRLGRKGLWQEAMLLFSTVPEPDPFLRMAALDACAKSWMLKWARQVFDEMPAKPAAAYTTLIALLGRMRRIQEAEGLFREMRGQSVEPDIAAYTALMIAYGSVHDAGAAARVLDDIEGVGLPLGPVEFGAALRACGKAGDTERATELLARMDRERVDVNIGHLTSIVVSCARGKQEARGREAFEEIRRRGLKPDRVAYTSLIGCFDGLGALASAEALLADMTAESVAPDVFFFEEMLRSALASENPQRFREILTDVDARGLPRSSGIATLMQGLDDLVARHQDREEGARSLPDGWCQTLDTATGRMYYWKEADPRGTTTWECPVA